MELAEYVTRSMSSIAALYGLMVAFYKAWLGLYISVGADGVERRSGMAIVPNRLLCGACNKEVTGNHPSVHRDLNIASVNRYRHINYSLCLFSPLAILRNSS